MTICGTVRSVDLERSRGKAKKGMYALHLHVHSIVKHRSAGPTRGGGASSGASGSRRARAAGESNGSGSQGAAAEEGGGASGGASGDGESYTAKEKVCLCFIYYAWHTPFRTSNPAHILTRSP